MNDKGNQKEVQTKGVGLLVTMSVEINDKVLRNQKRLRMKTGNRVTKEVSALDLMNLGVSKIKKSLDKIEL